MTQHRFVVMLPMPLKRRLKAAAADRGVPMRTLIIEALEGELGTDWREDGKPLPGTQNLFPSGGNE